MLAVAIIPISLFIGLGPCPVDAPSAVSVGELSFAACLVGYSSYCVPRFWWLGAYAFAVPLLLLHGALGHLGRAIIFALAAVSASLVARRFSASHGRTTIPNDRNA